MEEVIKQAPLTASLEEIGYAFDKNNSNVVDTLSYLWGLEDTFIIDNEQDETRKKLKEARELFDYIDGEMYKKINKS